jgi:surfeit locus 1 family protein
MHQQTLFMTKLRIKNWTLGLVSLIFFCVFVSLGLWQVNRSIEKKGLLESFNARSLQPPLLLSHLEGEATKDLRFYRATLNGHFDEDHIFLLDNKIFHGQVGYEIYVPFHITGSKKAILVDRGFVQAFNREKLPVISKAHVGQVLGVLNLPPKYFAFGNMVDSNQKTGPLRIEFVNLKQLEKIINYPLFPYVLSLAKDHPAAYPIEWQIVIMGPHRHLGYAFQWFALAFTLLILFIALNIERQIEH